MTTGPYSTEHYPTGARTRSADAPLTRTRHGLPETGTHNGWTYCPGPCGRLLRRFTHEETLPTDPGCERCRVAMAVAMRVAYPGAERTRTRYVARMVTGAGGPGMHNVHRCQP